MPDMACCTNPGVFETGCTKPRAWLSKPVCVFFAFICLAVHTGTRFNTATGTELLSDPPRLGLGFSVQTLSRGSGVPEPARQALQRVRQIVSRLRDQNISVETREIPIGLEGERQLCITFANAPDAVKAWRQFAAAVEAVDLINLDPRPC